MNLIVNSKEYKSKKITGKLYENYLETSEKIEKHQRENGVGWERESQKMAREFLVALFDNQFTEDDLLEDVEVSTVIAYFMLVDKTIQDQVTSKLEKIAKN